jgi:hypothetical protein
MGLKQPAIGNTLEEHIGNLGNPLGIWWENVGNKGKMKKILLPLSPPPQNPLPKLKRKKNQGTLSACRSHWLHENSISKTVCHHFWPELIPPGIINWGYLFIHWDNHLEGILFHEVIAPIFYEKIWLFQK